MNYSYQDGKRLKRISFVILFLVFIQSNVFVIQNDPSLVISPSDSSITIQPLNIVQLLQSDAENIDAGYIEWLSDVALEENTGFIRDLKIAFDGANNTHIFWVQYIDNNWQLLEKIKFAVNESWNNPRVLSSITDSNELWMFDVVTSNDGRIHLTWENNGQIFYRYYDNPLWGSISFITYGKEPKIDISLSNNPGIIYTQTSEANYNLWTHHKFAAFSAINDSWDYSEFGYYWDGRDSKHDFTTNIQNGKEYFQGIVSHLRKTWNRDERRYYTNFSLDSISKANDSEILQIITVEDNPLPERSIYWNTEPILLSDKVDKMYAFVDYWGENGQEIFCYQYNGGTWGSRIGLSTTVSTDVTVIHKTAAIDLAGGITSVWSERRFVNSSVETGKLQIKSYKPKLGWSETAYLQTNLTYSRSPYLTFDVEGNAHLIWWEDFEGEKTLYYRFGYGDVDGDGLSNKDENDIHGTNPYDPDTDDDQMSDGEEISNGYNPFDPDQDTDLMLDGWEFHHSLNPLVNDSYLDFDGDMLYNIEEFWENTLPDNNDTDADNVSDYHEIRTYFTNPFSVDTDDDWVTDGIEINDLGSNPLSNDTDSDGMRDWYEWVYNIKILVNDTTEDPDNDGLWNMYEYEWGINPNKPDHDDDGLLDGDEVLVWFTHPIVRDTDKDSIWDGAEVHTYGTNPLKMDTDDDFLKDWIEIINGLDPLDNDTDDDLILDGYEYYFGLDPLNSSDANLDYDFDNLTNIQEGLLWTDPYESDTDFDGFTDLEELAFGSDPTLADTDQDGLDDYAEIIVLLTNVTNPDTDYDGLFDGLEVHVYFSNPFIQDSDGDTLIDGDEVYIYYTDPSTIHSDSDLLADNLELLFGTDPNIKDTDYDQMDDFWEWQYGLNGTKNDANLDPDNDNVTNIVEYSQGSNPLLVESDGDGVPDYDEIYIHHTHPGMNDTDEDGLSDYDELFVYHTIPYDIDSDDDELPDGYEIEIGTDPLHIDTDRDGVSDSQELKEGTDPLEPTSNAFRITLITFLIVSSIVLSSLALYYGIPWTISKRKSRTELSWMKEGLEAKQQKNRELEEKEEKN